MTSILYILGCRTLPKPVISYDHDLAKGNNWSYRDLGNKVLRLKKKKKKKEKCGHFRGRGKLTAIS